MQGRSPAAPRVVCVGALVVDLTFWVPRRPEPGETLQGTRFEEFLGGKGFNQAVAAARLGAEVALVGAVGRDHYGDRFVDTLRREGVDTSCVFRVDEGTGVGQPLVTDDGEVSIIGIPRANRHLSGALVERAEPLIARADYVVLQCEVPAAANRRAAELAREHEVPLMLNPAPANDSAVELAPFASLIILNHVEAGMLLRDAALPPSAAAAALQDRFGCAVVVTLGERGALARERAHEEHVRAHRVETVDPTGAGDAFCAAYTVATASQRGPVDALRFANAAGALAVQVAGAEPSMPLRAAVEALAAERAAQR